jgi:hypothetical protein
VKFGPHTRDITAGINWWQQCAGGTVSDRRKSTEQNGTLLM